jgi:hypothetical protein
MPLLLIPPLAKGEKGGFDLSLLQHRNTAVLSSFAISYLPAPSVTQDLFHSW